MTIPRDIVQEYLAALDEVRQVAPGRWVNLKGAARHAAIRCRKARLTEAERRLREAASEHSTP